MATPSSSGLSTQKQLKLNIFLIFITNMCHPYIHTFQTESSDLNLQKMH